MASELLKTIDFGDGVKRAVAADWSNVQNKPFTTVGGDTLTWDGNTDGLKDFEGMFYHVSDAYPTLLEAQNGASGTLSTDATGDLTVIDMTEFLGFECYQLYLNGEIPFALCSSQNFEEDGVQVLCKGIYLLADDGVYTSSLTINGYTGFVAEKLKANYLPDDVCGMIVELDLSTATNNEVTVSDVNYTPIYDHYKKGGTVLIKAESDAAENYFGVSAVVKSKDDGYLYVYYFVADAMWVAVFTTP